jgi:hypothetical protein
MATSPRRSARQPAGRLMIAIAERANGETFHFDMPEATLAGNV